MSQDGQGSKQISVSEFGEEMARLESAFRDKLPDDTLAVYYSALNDRTQKDIALAVNEIIASENGNRVPNISTIKLHLSHVKLGGYFE